MAGQETPSTIEVLPGLRKTILKAGTPVEIEEGSQVSVHYTGTLSDGTVFDSTFDRIEPFVFKLGCGMAIEAIDRVVRSMNLREVCKIEAAPSFGFGRPGFPPRVPPNSSLTFEIELLEVSPFQASDFSLEQLLDLALKDKEKGNNFVGKKKFEYAEACYQMAINRFQNLHNLSDEDKNNISKFKVPVYLNLALCDLKLSQPSRAIAHCNEALSQEPDNIKAHHRIAEAYEICGELNAAKFHWTQKARISPSKETYAEVERIKKKISEQKKEKDDKAGSMWVGIFNKS
eukprot:TRINITY_DN9533_c0_g1_i1.p1 TRINITY_DN9533_c0_g1~~TRINITY_DN9533_c0_g1_i1.p1  ORF type:complete len:288 (-),score=54.42 TRINITY_DN9533_c0_g1_i1:13-876(-)